MENVINTNDGGVIELRQFEDGIEYAVYIPKDVNPDTPVFTYVYGSGREKGWYSKNGGGSYGPFDALIEKGSNSIVIMPSMRWGENWGEKTMEIVNSVRDEYGITNNNLSGGGFSYGGFGGYEVVAENLKQNGASNLEPQIVYFVDDYSKKTHEGYASTLKSEEMDLFRENNTVFFSYQNNSKWSGAANAYAKAGLNMIRVKCDNGEHIAIKEDFFKNSVYDYMNGGRLPADGYTYERANVSVDPKTGKETVTWEKVDVSQIDTKEELYSLFGIDGDVNSIKTTPITNSSSISERGVFVDLASLQEWRSQLDMINDESIEQLAKILSTISSLEDSWEGNFASGFIEDCSSMVRDAQNVHNNMKGALDPLLTEVVNVESNL